MTPEQKKLSKTIRNLYRDDYNAEVKAGLGVVRKAIYNTFIRAREEKPFKFWGLMTLAVAGAGLLGFSLPTMAGTYAVAGSFFAAILPQALTEFSIKRETERNLKEDVANGILVERYKDDVILPRQMKEVGILQAQMRALQESHQREHGLLDSLKTHFNAKAAEPAVIESIVLTPPLALPKPEGKEAQVPAQTQPQAAQSPQSLS